MYGCRVILTNVSSIHREVDVLKQIPMGAVPLKKGVAMTTERISLSAYTTKTLSFYFYFPKQGSYLFYPVQVSARVSQPRWPTRSYLNPPAVAFYHNAPG